MKWLIPSYLRCGRVITLDTLSSLGVDRSDMVIGVQTEEDYREYSRAYEGYRIHLSAEATNAAGNRNGLARLFMGETVAFVDDDVLGFEVIRESKGKVVRTERLDGRGFQKMLSEGFRTGADIWGINVGGNHYFHNQWARRHGSVSKGVLLIGDFMVMRECGAVMFDERVDMGEDYDISLTALELGYDVARLNRYAVRPYKPEGAAKGGCSELYAMGDTERHKLMKRQVVDKHGHTARFHTSRKDCCVVVKRRGTI